MSSSARPTTCVPDAQAIDGLTTGPRTPSSRAKPGGGGVVREVEQAPCVKLALPRASRQMQRARFESLSANGLGVI